MSRFGGNAGTDAHAVVLNDIDIVKQAYGRGTSNVVATASPVQQGRTRIRGSMP